MISLYHVTDVVEKHSSSQKAPHLFAVGDFRSMALPNKKHHIASYNLFLAQSTH